MHDVGKIKIPDSILNKPGRLTEEEYILRFATDWRVPYTNNAAEQAIRFARVKEKVCAAMMLSPRILVAP